LLFFSLSQMNSLMRCHFSLSRATVTSCRLRWPPRAVAGWMLASSILRPPPLASSPIRHRLSWPF
jgi:hypothetical protein